MQVHLITDKTEWENFAPLRGRGLFLQSFAQKELYESLGQKTWLFEMKGESGTIRSLVTKVEARRGVFLFLPYGPLLSNLYDENDLRSFFDFLRALGREEKAHFIRVSPFWDDGANLRFLMKQLGFRPAPIHMLAEMLWILPLQGKTELELLSGLEKKHRNLVRRAMKEGVAMKASSSSDAVERFIALHRETVDRHGFTPYPMKYFREQVRCFSKESDAVIILEAWKQDALLASAIIMLYGDSAAYHHGASSSKSEHRKIPASYLLQWEAIRMAKAKGMKQYNFWGVAPETNPKHPFHGITHFKKGFGGQGLDLLPCHDLPLSPRYALNWALERFRKWKRGF